MSALPHPLRYTIADWEQWEGDWELWDGRPVAMSPSPRATHQELMLALAETLRRGLRGTAGCTCRVFAGLDWRVGNGTVFRPDLSVACRE